MRKNKGACSRSPATVFKVDRLVIRSCLYSTQDRVVERMDNTNNLNGQCVYFLMLDMFGFASDLEQLLEGGPPPQQPPQPLYSSCCRQGTVIKPAARPPQSLLMIAQDNSVQKCGRGEETFLANSIL